MTQPATPSTQMTVRLQQAERESLAAASLAIRIPTSQLVQAAIQEAAFELGIRAYFPRPRCAPPAWLHVPARESVTARGERTTFNVDAITYQLLRTAAAYVGVPRHLFLLGAAQRFVAMRPALSHAERPPPPPRKRR
jgi:hypothetical protein